MVKPWKYFDMRGNPIMKNPAMQAAASAAAGVAMDYANRYIAKSIGTPQRTKEQYEKRRGPKARKLGGFGAKLGGRIRKGKRIRLWKNSKKAKGFKSTQVKLSKIQAKGVLLTREVGISTSGVSDAVYLGHATFARTQYMETVMSMLIKKILAKVGVHIKNFGDTISMDPADVIILSYKNNADDGTAEIDYSWAYSTPVTYQSIVNDFVSNFSTGGYQDRIFTRIDFFNTTSRKRATIPLSNATVDVYVKSSMKLQNTTISAAGAEADEVDNVPINGKSYYGRGNGTSSNRDRSTESTFWATEDTGIIKKVGTVSSGLSEMPPAGYFRSVKKVGKVRINPGTVKYSTLTDQVTVSFNWLMKNLHDATHTKDVKPIGQFRFFGFEHVIKAAADAPLLKVFGEVNYQIGMALNAKLTTITDQKVSSAYVTY